MTSLEEIKRLLAAATPGPLFTAWSEASETLEITSAARKGMVGIAQIETGFNADFDAEQKANAELVVAAVNEIGGIIEQVERLQKVADAAEELPDLYDDAMANPYDVGYSQVSDQIEALRQALESLQSEGD